MKIARYQLHDAVHYGVLEGEHLERLSGSPFDGITPAGQIDALADAKLGMEAARRGLVIGLFSAPWILEKLG